MSREYAVMSAIVNTNDRATIEADWRADMVRRVRSGEPAARYHQAWRRMGGEPGALERVTRDSPSLVARSSTSLRSSTFAPSTRATRTAAALAAIAASRAAQTRIENYVRVMKATPNRGYFDARPTDGIKKAVDLYFSK